MASGFVKVISQWFEAAVSSGSFGSVELAVTGNEQTWLILPVVICLSQRLSHACLSISSYMAKLRMAH